MTIPSIKCKSDEKTVQLKCTSIKYIVICFQAKSSIIIFCGWCLQGFDADNKARCDLTENLISNGCDDSFIMRPDHNFTANQVRDILSVWDELGRGDSV